MSRGTPTEWTFCCEGFLLSPSGKLARKCCESYEVKWFWAIPIMFSPRSHMHGMRMSNRFGHIWVRQHRATQSCIRSNPAGTSWFMLLFWSMHYKDMTSKHRYYPYTDDFPLHLPISLTFNEAMTGSMTPATVVTAKNKCRRIHLRRYCITWKKIGIPIFTNIHFYGKLTIWALISFNIDPCLHTFEFNESEKSWRGIIFHVFY